MNYKVNNIVWNVDNYDRQYIKLELPKSIIVPSGFLEEFVYHNLVQTKQALINYLESTHGMGIIDCNVELADQ